MSANQYQCKSEHITISEIPAFSLECDYIFALCTFLDEFYESDMDEKAWMLANEPVNGILDKVQYCKLAAAAHKLANDYNLPVPSWVMKNDYFMPYPVYSFDTDDTEYQKLLIDITPNEYKIRNLFLGANLLTRA